MEVILLERVAKLGQMGEVVRVRDGYARNFLLPSGKALRATESNRQKFERDRSMLEQRNAEKRALINRSTAAQPLFGNGSSAAARALGYQPTTPQ